MRKDGTRFWASVVIDRIVDEAGNLIGFAKVTRDLTERKKAQDELKSVQEQLVASQKLEAVGQLSGGIAHDFNNLLMIVLGNIETAERHSRHLAGSINIQRALTNAKRGAQRAAALTSRLLAFSRRQALDPKPINLNTFLNGLQDFLQRTLGEGIEVQTVGSAGLWQIEADTNHLESAIINLSINARDAMPGGGKLTVEAANVSADEDYCRTNPELSPGQYVILCVTDTGDGMTKEISRTRLRAFLHDEGAWTGYRSWSQPSLRFRQTVGWTRERSIARRAKAPASGCIFLATMVLPLRLRTRTKNWCLKARSLKLYSS